MLILTFGGDILAPIVQRRHLKLREQIAHKYPAGNRQNQDLNPGSLKFETLCSFQGNGVAL